MSFRTRNKRPHANFHESSFNIEDLAADQSLRIKAKDWLKIVGFNFYEGILKEIAFLHG
jgi:hypothetical protein